MVSELLLACVLTGCPGGVCPVQKEVTRTKVVEKVVAREVAPVRRILKREKSRYLFARRAFRHFT